MKKDFITLIVMGAAILLLPSCESPEEKAKRLAVEELSSLNITAPQYDAQLVAESAKGSVKRMQLLLTAGADANSPNAEGKTALIAAIQSRNPEAVKLLLEVGANIHAKNAAEETALHIAAAGGYGNVISILLEKGANVNEPDATGRTPLLTAIVSRNMSIIQTLIDAGADVNAAASNGTTALHLAAKMGNKALVASFLEKGADCTKADATGATALSLAVTQGHHEIAAQLLAAGAKPDVVDSEGNTLLMHAATNGDVDMMDMLVKAGVDVNHPNNKGATALHQALASADSVQYLIKAGSDINKADNQGYTALMKAISQRSPEVVKLLINANVSTEPNCPGGMPLIAFAAERGNTEIVQMLLNTGLDATISFKHHGRSINALSCATSDEVRNLLKRAGCIEVISTDKAIELLQRYEIINVYESGKVRPGFTGYYYDNSYRETSEKFLYNYQLYKDGRKQLTDFDYVGNIYTLWEKNKEHMLPLECIASFIVAGAVAYSEQNLLSAAEHGHIEIVKLLLAVPGIDINKSDALSSAIWADHIEIVKLLLAVPGIDINKSNALSSAAKVGNIKIVKLLLAVPGIDINKSDALISAVRKGHTEIVKLLLAVPGIDVNESDALHAAAEHGRTEIVKLLLAVPGIDINKKKDIYNTPLYAARCYHHWECAKLLEDALAAQQTHAPGTAKPTVKTAQTGSDTTFDGLDSHISRIDYMTAGNATLKLYKKRLLTLLPMIKEGKGVDVTIPDSKGNTSLHYACGIGDVELVKWLLEHGANANAKTDKGKSPRECIGKNRDSITRLLRQYGGN